MVRSLLARGKIPKSFWPEAVNWSIHVLNRCPTFSVQNMTPEKGWSGRKPVVDHFKIFGSPIAVETSPTATESTDLAIESRLHRVRKRPGWMIDYETIGVKWVYKTKLNENGEIDKYRAQLVAKGYKQEFGVDYKEVFAPVARLDTTRFQMKDCNPVLTPTELGLKLTKHGAGKMVNATLYKQIVGSLMYLTSTRPDIMYAMSLISRYMENPSEVHLLAAKRIFRYLKALELLLGVLHNQQQGPILIYCDNVSAIKLSRNPVLHGRSKHIDVRFHLISTSNCRFVNQALKPPVFMKLRRMLGVCSSKDIISEEA
ncbi:hypothetical protein AAG906_004468 [Vitis piasezkii]